MCKITVKFYAPKVLEAVGTDMIEVEFKEGATVSDLIEKLCREFGEKFYNVIFNSRGGLSEDFIILLNGENIMIKEGLKSRIKDNDMVIVMSPLSGGIEKLFRCTRKSENFYSF